MDYQLKKKYSKLANDLMTQHGLYMWRLQWSTTKRIAGQCFHGKKVIKLSSVVNAQRTEEMVTDTILHEIAHALVGVGHGHDHVWKAKAREIGCNAERCYDGDEEGIEIESRYVGECKKCGYTSKRHRLPKGRSYSCGKCSSTFDPNNLMVWTDMKIGKFLGTNEGGNVRVYRANKNHNSRILKLNQLDFN